jgi:diguanylate cyclase (GGDEF)-like protein/PAS domain S-box-containing protein
VHLSKLNWLVFLASIVATAVLYLLRDVLPPPITDARTLTLDVLASTICAMLTLMTFTVGWLTYSIERSWPMTLLSSLLFGVGMYELGAIVSHPGMAALISENTAQKAALFNFTIRFGVAFALLVTAATARMEIMSARIHHSYALILTLIICGILHLGFVFYPASFPDMVGNALLIEVLHATLLAMFIAGAIVFTGLIASGIEWAFKMLQACALLLVSEINFILAGGAPSFHTMLDNLLFIAGLVLIYRGVFQHSIRIPIDAMNTWRARLKTSQNELHITKLAVDNSGYYLFMYDNKGVPLYINDNVKNKLGYSEQDLADQTSLTVQLFEKSLLDLDRTPLHENGYMVLENALRTKSGATFPVEVTITMIIEDGEPRYCVIVHDITERKLYEQQREETTDLQRRLIDSIPHFVTVLDTRGNVVSLNKTLMGSQAFDLNHLRGTSYLAWTRPFLLDNKSYEDLDAALQRAMQGESTRCDICVGSEKIRDYVECSLSPVYNNDGKFDHIIVTGVLVTERVHSQNELKLAATVFDHSAEAFLIADGAMHTLSVNRAFTTITGFDEADIVGTTPLLFEEGKHIQPMHAALSASGNWSGEVEWLRKDGGLCFEWVTVTKVVDKDDITTNYIVIFSDITEKKRSEEHIQYLAYYDPLTSLPNRVLLEDRVKQAIAAAKHNMRKIALMFLDLDHFKTINDSLGHHRGDKLLAEVGSRLTRCVREADTVARLGGDEFVILLSDISDAQGASAVAHKLLTELQSPYLIDGTEFRLTVSIGVSVYPDDGDDFSRLIMNADAAMYHAKDNGRNNVQFFIGEMNRRATELLDMETRLRRAIERKEFILHFQPQIDLHANCIIGFEALVRWQDPDRGMIPPIQFIPIAEERGLIKDIGNWVLREACRQNREWQDTGLPRLPIAVNISAKQFRDRDFVSTVRFALNESGLEPRYLELEVTETAVMQDAENLISTLEELKQLGVLLAIDDFGTGYSSLSYLKRFPIEKIKIDRSFIRDLPGDKDDYSIVCAIIGLTHQLNLKVMAEGVETIEQLECLRDVYCDAYQGFYFSKPIPADQAAQILRGEFLRPPHMREHHLRDPHLHDKGGSN